MATKVNKSFKVWSAENTNCRAEYEIFASSKSDARVIYAGREGVSVGSVVVESLGRPYTANLVCPILRRALFARETAGVALRY